MWGIIVSLYSLDEIRQVMNRIRAKFVGLYEENKLIYKKQEFNYNENQILEVDIIPKYKGSVP